MPGQEYDAIVIGAGPAGSAAALRLARSGACVLLVEKRERIGHPVRCAEATGPREEIARFTPVREEWITADIGGARFISPRGTILERPLPGIGVMLDRDRFDAGLAAAAGEAGAEVRAGCEVTRLERREEGWAVSLREGAQEREARARLVVGADGVESLVGRWAGIRSGWKAEELYSCVEVRVRNSRDCDGYLEFHFGDEIAPGGYGWAFPKGGNEWNVGVGVDPARSDRRPASLYLERLLARFAGDAQVARRMAGAACRSRSLPAVSGEGVLLAGDAAHQGNPLTGGGIMNALEAGDMAGKVAAEALAGPGPTAATLARYDEEWRRAVGRTNDRYHRLAQVFYSQDDEAMERIWDGMGAIFRKRDQGAPRLSLMAEFFALPGDFARALAPLALAGAGRRHLF